MKKLVILLTVTFLCVLILQLFPVSAGTEFAKTAFSPAAQEEAASRLYGIGSVSKVFTAAAVMKLVEDGKLSLDEPLVTYISDFEMVDERYVDITPRMLLNHSSGFMGMTDNNAFLMGDNDTYNHDHFLDFLKSQTLTHTPGEISVYSNDSFTLAEILVERVSNISFTEFLELNFLNKLGIQNIQTPQSDFDRDALAAVYFNAKQMKPENLGVIGSGGIYSSMEDLCQFAALFMDSADGSILSKQSVDEMAKNQHRAQLIDENAHTTFAYGLGWDCVNLYPFSQYGIKALSKGGATGMYHTNLTVLPEHNLAVAVSSSGRDAKEQQIVTDIILAILREEGLIDSTELEMPVHDAPLMLIPENLKEYAGFYDMGQGYLVSAEFTGDKLILTPIGIRNERPQEYTYHADGKFASTNGDYIGAEGLTSSQDGTSGTTVLEFVQNKYIVAQIYEMSPSLIPAAFAMPVAEKIDLNVISPAVMQAWKERNSKEYLLVSEKYSSAYYITAGVAKIHTDDRVQGYVGMGVYQSAGKTIKNAKIMDEQTAVGYQSTPTMVGRDTNNLKFVEENGVEVLLINSHRYIDAATISKTAEIEETIKITSGALWFDVDAETSGRSWFLQAPKNGSWFVYDKKMRCIASSLEKDPRNEIVLPENGRIAFIGEVGASFTIRK